MLLKMKRRGIKFKFPLVIFRENISCVFFSFSYSRTLQTSFSPLSFLTSFGHIPSFFSFHGQSSSLVIIVSKDPSTHKYLAIVYQDFSIRPLCFFVKFGGSFLWMGCEGSSSSDSNDIRCIQCTMVVGVKDRNRPTDDALGLIIENLFVGLEGKRERG